MGKVTVSGLQVNTIIGTLPDERIRKQRLIISLSFEYSATAAAANDDLTASVDYSAVEKAVVEAAEKSSFLLLEALAAHLGRTVLAFAGVKKVTVSIDKPAASAYGALISYSEEFFPEEA